MIKKPFHLSNKHFLFILMMSITASFFNKAKAQNSVQIVQADSIVGGTINGERVQKIIGDVQLQSEEITLMCDSAYQYNDKNEMEAFSNIEINTEEENIWADSLTYHTDVDFAQLRGRVVIENQTDSTTLFSEAVDYRFSSKVAHFLEKVRLKDPEGMLRANTGFYYREPDSAVFRGQVQLSDADQYAESDSLFVNRRSGFYQFHSNLYVDDLENEVRLKGDFLEADSTGRRTIEGNAWMMDFSSDTTESDTTHIRSQTLISRREVTSTDTSNTIDAYENVRIWSPKFSAISDTARYQDSTEVFELWSNPKAWNDDTQLTGPHINVHLEGDEVRRLYSYPNPISVQEDTVLERYHQMTGDTLIADFEEGVLSQIKTYENAHILRFNKDDNDEPDGALELFAPVVFIIFKDGELNRLKAEGSNDGSYLPESEETAELRLEGFSWTPEERPQRPAEKMGPRFAPITPVHPFDLPTRYQAHLIERQRASIQE